MKYLLIANPVSGGGLARRQINTVVKIFERHGHKVDVRITRAPGDAEVYARWGASAGYDAIIGGGGDGTINEVLNGMYGSDRPLAIIPWGTGNVFAKEMRFPRKLGALCRMIMKGETRRLDLGVANGRRFLLMAGAGMDGYTLRAIKGQGLKKRLGTFAYAMAAIKAFADYRYPEIQIELADGRRDSGSFVLISNTRVYGNVFSFTPRADPSDGLLDVFVFRETGRWNTLILALRYLGISLIDPNVARTPLGLKEDRLYRCTGLTVRSSREVVSQVDGEVYCGLPLEFSVIPSALNVILPHRFVWTASRSERA